MAIHLTGLSAATAYRLVETQTPANHSTSTPASKRPWVAPEISALRVERTELGSGYYAEKVGQYGCTFYDASSATKYCVVT